MFASRLGSLFLESLYKFAANHIKPLLWAHYADYCVAIKTVPRIKTLVEDANMYRTFCVVAVIICVYGIFLGDIRILIDAIVVAIIMLMAYAKQNCYIAKSVMQEVGKDGKGKDKNEKKSKDGDI